MLITEDLMMAGLAFWASKLVKLPKDFDEWH